MPWHRQNLQREMHALQDSGTRRAHRKWLQHQLAAVAGRGIQRGFVTCLTRQGEPWMVKAVSSWTLRWMTSRSLFRHNFWHAQVQSCGTLVPKQLIRKACLWEGPKAKAEGVTSSPFVMTVHNASSMPDTLAASVDPSVVAPFWRADVGGPASQALAHRSSHCCQEGLGVSDANSKRLLSHRDNFNPSIPAVRA